MPSRPYHIHDGCGELAPTWAGTDTPKRSREEWGCCNAALGYPFSKAALRVSQMGVLNREIPFLAVVEATSLRSVCQQVWCLLGPLSLDCRGCLLTTSSHAYPSVSVCHPCPHLFLQGHPSYWIRACSSDLITSLRSLSPVTF